MVNPHGSNILFKTRSNENCSIGGHPNWMFDFEQMEGNPQRRQRQISEKFQQFPGGLLKRMHQVTAYNPKLTFYFL